MEDQPKRSINWKWFGVLTMIVIMVGTATYFMLPTLLPKAEDDIAIIKASDGPIKIRVNETEEQTVDHQDLLVVEILKNGQADDGQTETLRPGAASPEPPPVEDPNSVAAIDKGQAAPEDKAKTITETAAAEPPSTHEPGPEEALKEAPETPAASAANSTTGKQAAPPKAAPEKPVAPTTKKLPQSKPESKPTASISKRVIVIEGDAPLYMIQLAAFRNQKKADEIAVILSEKHKTRLGDATLETMRIDTNANGTFHRVVSAPMPRNEADILCSALRRAGQDCFLRKYEPPKN